MSSKKVFYQMLAALLVVALSGSLQLAQAWQQQTNPPSGGETQATPAPTPAPATPVPGSGTESQPATPAPTQGTAPAQQPPAQQGGTPPQTGTTPAPSGTNVDPSQGPLEPAPTEAAPEALPSAESTGGAAPDRQPAADDTVVNQLPDKPAPQKPTEPVGAATAEKGRTAGGAASKPAGAAIAPAKQRQVRSFLIKLGAIAGVGLAVGTVYMLSRGTPSTPPGALR